LIAVSSAILAVFSVLFVVDVGAPESSQRVAALQEPGAPVAIIAPLPSEVSNGTFSYLDGHDSYDLDGLIVNYTWEIMTGDTVQYLYTRSDTFMFSKLGLYLITLTVKDNSNLTDEAFTAVYSIADSDSDALPDWWEMAHFYSLDESGSGDSDGDGWTNFQEYANGLDPTEEDPQPGLIQELKNNWYYLVIIAAVVVAAILLMLPRLKRKRKAEEKKKIKAALEIEKALEED